QISEAAFCRVYDRVRRAAAAGGKEMGKAATYFEMLTAMAFLFFSEEAVDVAVVEVGIGGRLDATNAPQLRTAVCGFTPISRDHTRLLGEDLLSIAREKAGIMRPGVPVVMAPQTPAVASFLREEAVRRGCQLYMVGEEVKAILRQPPPLDAPEAPQRLDIFTWRARHHDVPLPLLGEHQIVNAATALALAEVFTQRREAGPLDTACLRRAWREISIPGRIDVVARDPWVIIDGAHNPASAWALAETLQSRFSAAKRILVLAIAADKEVETILKILLPLASAAIMTTNGTSRSLAPEKLQELARGYGIETSSAPDPLQAVQQAIAWAGKRGLVCACGSLYLAGILLANANSLFDKD
ncbi:MAG: Mur ligase family protein, partial [Planctomycetota bacterium]|nr:Mur ligase family protein [Planctomycetota bacterium]